MRHILIFILLVSIKIVNGQDVYIENNYLKFKNIDIYEKYANKELDENDVYVVAKNLNKIMVLESDEDADELPYFLKNILNSDGIFCIGDWLLKIDYLNNLGYAIKNSVNDSYITLLKNDLSSLDLIKFTDETEDALEVLKAIDNKELTIESFKNANEETRIKWPWNRCKGAKRKTDKSNPYDIWDKGPLIDKSCPDANEIRYAMKIKVVYQKFIFYFSLHAKMISKTGNDCKSYTSSPQYKADLKIDSRAIYTKVNHCTTEYNDVNNSSKIDGNIHWRPYEGSRALSKYDFYADFSIRHENSGNPYYQTRRYGIIWGY